jgi:predicted RNA-binding protein with PUA-like domain
VDDFQAIGTSPWEGVRNYEARNLMKEMKEGDKVNFLRLFVALELTCAF